jgi:hypothetical protein
MNHLWAVVIPLALGAAVSPLLFTVQLATLTGPRRIARGLAVTLGAAVPVVGVSVAVLLFGRAVHLPHASPEVLGAIDLALAAVLFGLTIRALAKGQKPVPEEPPPKNASVGRSFGLGLAAMATNISTFALLIPAMKIVAQDDISVPDRAFVAVVVVLIVLLPALLPLVLTVVMPATSERVLTAIGSWLARHHHTLGVVLGFGFGIFLTIHGVVEIAKG